MAGVVLLPSNFAQRKWRIIKPDYCFQCDKKISPNKSESGDWFIDSTDQTSPFRSERITFGRFYFECSVMSIESQHNKLTETRQILLSKNLFGNCSKKRRVLNLLWKLALRNLRKQTVYTRGENSVERNTIYLTAVGNDWRGPRVEPGNQSDDRIPSPEINLGRTAVSNAGWPNWAMLASIKHPRHDHVMWPDHHTWPDHLTIGTTWVITGLVQQ